MTTPAPLSYPESGDDLTRTMTVETTDATRTVTTDLLTDDQMAYLRSELGPELTAEEVQPRWERLGDVQLVVLEVARERLAALVAGPAQFALAGVYSQNTGENIKALREQLTRVSAGQQPSVVQRARTRARRGR